MHPGVREETVFDKDFSAADRLMLNERIIGHSKGGFRISGLWFVI